MNRTRGFSLIELMIAIAVIGILIGIALPNYRSYVERGKMSEAFATLSQMATKLEQFYQDNRTYAGACTDETVAPKPAKTANFEYSCPTLSSTAYVVEAEGIGSMNGFKFQISTGSKKKTVSVGGSWSMPSDDACWLTAGCSS